MHKMYKKGLLQVKVQDPETSELVKKAADGLINTVDTQGSEGVMDWEVESTFFCYFVIDTVKIIQSAQSVSKFVTWI